MISSLGKLHCAHCDHSEDIRPDEENYKNAAEEPADKPRYCVNCGGLCQREPKPVPRTVNTVGHRW
ncbi:MAG: hypothetical protein ACLTDC_14195 [Lachnospiraceae bacterium]